jgi:hypothetical protein
MLVGNRRPDEATSMDADEVISRHKPRNPLARNMSASLGQVRPDSRHAIGAAAAGMAATDLGRQVSVGTLPC